MVVDEALSYAYSSITTGILDGCLVFSRSLFFTFLLNT